MTSPALARSISRSVRDVLLAGLTGARGGVVLSVARPDARALGQPVVVLFIAASALGFRLGARR
jgi:hypothetical protein